MYLVFLGILLGLILPMQTAINSQLRSYVKSPYTASMISFLIGTIFLTITALITKINLIISIDTFTSTPIWVWIGGILGAIWVTGNIFLFQKLGSVEATIMPLLGQIVMSMLIDNFGWLNSLQQPFTFTRLIGVVLMIIGVVLAIIFKNNVTQVNTTTFKTKIVWRFIGIFMGMLIAVQGTINGQLGNVLNSPVHAALISFGTGTIFLVLIAFINERTFKNILEPFKQKAPLWIWLGGCIGAIYVIINVILVGSLGIGQTIVIALFGQLTGSTLIEHFGLLKSSQNKVKLVQIIGLLLMFVGVIIIKIL